MSSCAGSTNSASSNGSIEETENEQQLPSPNPSTQPEHTSTPDEQQQQQQQPRRRTSVYEQKQIEAPTATKGSVIASRTQNLFKQYSKDMMATPEDEEGEKKNEVAEELKNVKLQYQVSV